MTRQHLEVMVNDCSAALDLGKAAEHLVCADLMLEGRRCFLSDQGLPYDILVDAGAAFVRIQVKATCFARNVNGSGAGRERMAYSWSARRRGKGGDKRLDASHCDVVALVALDIRVVAYVPQVFVGTTIQLSPPGYEFLTPPKNRGWGRRVDEFPFSEALRADAAFYAAARRGRA